MILLVYTIACRTLSTPSTPQVIYPVAKLLSHMAASAPQVMDPYKARAGYVEATDWAIPYWSSYLEENNIANHDMFSHVNCSYLSTPGRPPTLVALKKHAQSLAHLISNIAPSQGPGEINNENAKCANARSFVQDEAFDWLNNLEKSYKSDDPSHHRPLNALVNQAKYNSDTTGVDFFCPLENPVTMRSVKQEDEAARAREDTYQRERHKKPFARHWNLLRHANECLEILDHEFSNTGGLLSILPTEHEVEAEQLDLAKNTLIGEWLLFTQALVTRMHDLEIAYSNSLDALQGEALIPMQHMSAYGPDGRSGREMVFPQDRWIIANAGEDVMTYIHQVLDKKQIADESMSSTYARLGASGQILQDSATDSERGIVSVDLLTRFSRFKGSTQDRGPIFVLPAFGDRPGTKYTREIENRPTVVSVIEPKPLSSTAARLQDKYQEQQKVSAELKSENSKLKESLVELQKDVATYRDKAALEAVRSYSMLAAKNPDQNATADKIADLQKQLAECKQREQDQMERAKNAEQQAQDLLSNNYSQIKAAGVVPRDLDGHVTEKALKALLKSLRKAADDNSRLRDTLTALQQGARESNGKGTTTSIPAATLKSSS